MKAGWKTSEFWLTLATQVISLLVMLGVVAGSDVESISGAVKQAITAGFTLVASALVLWRYIQGRVELKKTEKETHTTLLNNGFTSVEEKE